MIVHIACLCFLKCGKKLSLPKLEIVYLAKNVISRKALKQIYGKLTWERIEIIKLYEKFKNNNIHKSEAQEIRWSYEHWQI